MDAQNGGSGEEFFLDNETMLQLVRSGIEEKMGGVLTIASSNFSEFPSELVLHSGLRPWEYERRWKPILQRV